jgi:general secretion pathway protein D
VETTVIVKDQGTVVIGGLIDDKLDTTDLKVPCLGDIPLLGWAFRTHGRNRGKTNLYIFLTPKVIENPMEASAVYKDKRSQIEAAREGTVNLYQEDDQRESMELPAPQPSETSPQGEGSPQGEDANTVEQAPRSALPPAVQEAGARVEPDMVDKPYLLEVAAFNARPPADTLIKRLQAKGYPAYLQQVGTGTASGTAQRYRVRLGAFETLGEAQLYQELLGDEGIKGEILTRPDV